MFLSSFLFLSFYFILFYLILNNGYPCLIVSNLSKRGAGRLDLYVSGAPFPGVRPVHLSVPCLMGNPLFPTN